jgi:putative membrane protein insertion efficiency factor
MAERGTGFPGRFEALSRAVKFMTSRSAPARVLQRGAVQLIRVYQLVLSPFLGGACRFSPSCSVYASEAIARLGLVTGTWLGMRRLSRCHPLGGSGLDSVPDEY